MLIVARAIIEVIPLHTRTPSASAATSTFEHDEKSPLLLSASVKKAAHAVSKYGSMLKGHHRTESRKARFKSSISRPISQDSPWSISSEAVEEAKQARNEMEQSVGSVYSTATWKELEGGSSNHAEPFEYEQRLSREDRSSIQTFASSERSYTFF